MADLAEKRVYADRTGASELLVAASPGLVSVALSAGRVGEFSLARRCAPTDIAAARHPDAGPTQVAVATDEDVLLAPRPAVEALEPSDFGPAVAVTFQAGQVVAGAADGRVAVHDGHRWTTVGEVPAPPAALDGDLVATPEGVFRLTDGDLRPAGLRAVSDVARPAGIPLAATADGLYELGNGWLAALDGEFRLATGARGGQAHAATADAFYERTADGWRSVELPAAGPVGAVAYGERPAVLTVDGDLLVQLDDGWRTHPLGVEGVVAAVAT
jgi:hypothetical protein